MEHLVELHSDIFGLASASAPTKSAIGIPGNMDLGRFGHFCLMMMGKGCIATAVEVVYDAKAPDTITSWVASAFAINDKAGLGLAPSTVKLKVFRPFFVRLELPYAVKRGEKMALQVLVFNYLENEQEHQPGFDFLQKDGSSIKKGKADKVVQCALFVGCPAAVCPVAVYFPIVFTDVGQLRLNVVAQADQASDALEQTLRVGAGRVPRGPQRATDCGPEQQRDDTFTNPRFGKQANRRPQTAAVGWPQPLQAPYRKVVDLQFPADHCAWVYRGKARVDVIWRHYGPCVVKRGGFGSDAIRLRGAEHGYGSWCRTLSSCVTCVPPNVSTHRCELKAKKYMEYGATSRERHLPVRGVPTIRFPPSASPINIGSTWLTAFVLRSFKQAQAYIFVDDRVLEAKDGPKMPKKNLNNFKKFKDSIAFLISQQLDKRRFC
ncbi:hypothetical protein niasHT_036284 [Heterodera trifolii]|uniref:Alpha-2-macroglobulin domain-containing protein n=1 Tax=Heterodera trifolii TaxID=157864 RepID=A0ABD2I0Q1_9BILA